MFLKRTSLVKMIISADKIRGEHKYQGSFEFRPFVRLMFSANELPLTGDKNECWCRQLKIIGSPNRFNKKDGTEISSFKEKLLTEIPDIFNWALEGWLLVKEITMTMDKEIDTIKLGFDEEVCRHFLSEYNECDKEDFPSRKILF